MDQETSLDMLILALSDCINHDPLDKRDLKRSYDNTRTIVKVAIAAEMNM